MLCGFIEKILPSQLNSATCDVFVTDPEKILNHYYIGFYFLSFVYFIFFKGFWIFGRKRHQL